jgi:hypothetical protein
MKFNTYFRIILPLSTVALVAMTLNAYATETPTVVDPVSGQSMPVSEIDMPNLTDEQRQDIRDQMTEMGMDQQSREAHGMPEGQGGMTGMNGMSGMTGMGNASGNGGGNGSGGNGGGNGSGGNGGGNGSGGNGGGNGSGGNGGGNGSGGNGGGGNGGGNGGGGGMGGDADNG